MFQTFRRIGFAEGISFLLLMGVAMPLKYALGIRIAVKIMGWIHGTLFIAYVTLARQIAREQRWPSRQERLAYLSAVLPFGTFVFDHKFLRPPELAPKGLNH
jgi:integral membrane protein